ncbi:MAG: ABC transporter ATP-binding protein [Wenyingzhuangia sp.]|jgi:ABC-2 type transport system ATP-binding protein|uniref:ABC transporter ATP-binding protein n=1 Tax=Wenyingzhuangia sp. TaxID=1964193 RepID=UPI00321A4611
MSETILKIQEVSKSYGLKLALKNVSINIKKGSIYGLIGQNGAGKTSLLRILNQIIEADQGKILFKGLNMTSKSVKEIGYLPEERGLYKNMTIEEQALYFAQLKGMTKSKALKQLNYWLDRFEILEWKKKKTQSLSKGMAQKVQFMIAVIHQPDLLILDEPFSGFDPINANLIAKEIKNLAQEGTTIIFSSHRMESVAEMCNDICLLHHGKIILEGSVEALQKQHAKKNYEATLSNISEVEWESFLSNPSYKTQWIQTKNKEMSLTTEETSNGADKLLEDLLKVGQVVSFTQHLPSLQDIFIKTIENE